MTVKRPKSGDSAAARKGRLRASPAGGQVGRKLTKRIVAGHDEAGAAVAYAIKPEQHSLSLDRHMLAATSALEAAGLPVDELLAQAPGGGLIREAAQIVGFDPDDSTVGLAARIVELCLWLETAPTVGYPVKHLMLNAYRLGRLVVIAHAYGIEDDAMAAMRKLAAYERTTYTKEVRAEWVRLYGEKYRGRTFNDAAGLIAKASGLPARAIQSIRKELGKKVGRSL